MPQIQETRNPRDFFIIDTRTPTTAVPGQPNPGRDFKDLNLLANADYREMASLHPKDHAQLQVDGGAPINIRMNVKNYHDMVHMTPEVFQYQVEKRTDSNGKEISTGLIWIPKDKIDDARRIFNLLKKMDKDVSWELTGLSLSEEELKQKPSEQASPVGGLQKKASK